MQNGELRMAEEQEASGWMICSAMELRVDCLTVLETLDNTIATMLRMLVPLALSVSISKVANLVDECTRYCSRI